MCSANANGTTVFFFDILRAAHIVVIIKSHFSEYESTGAKALVN